MQINKDKAMMIGFWTTVGTVVLGSLSFGAYSFKKSKQKKLFTEQVKTTEG